MTKKDYEIIAKALAGLSADFNNSGSDEISLSLVAKELASALALDNPRFDRDRFLAAALMTSEKREAIRAALA